MSSIRSAISLSPSFMWRTPYVTLGLTLNDIATFSLYGIKVVKEKNEKAASAGIAANDFSLYSNVCLAAGREFELDYYWFKNVKAVIELNKLFTSNEDYKRLAKILHLGTELSIDLFDKVPFDIRAGINEGYLSFGVGLKLFVFNLEYATYSEELGTSFREKPLNMNKFMFSLDI